MYRAKLAFDQNHQTSQGRNAVGVFLSKYVYAVIGTLSEFDRVVS
jgi:hypothetical protein